MERQKRQGAEYEFYGKLPLKKAIPLGLQHVLAMFVGNLTPILIISGACGIAGEEFGSLQVDLLQNAMLIAGIVTEYGVARAPYTESLKEIMERKAQRG